MTAPSAALARSITRAANGHADATIRWLVDRRQTDDAYRAYAYFRWVDDCLDLGDLDPRQSLAFLDRQRTLIASAYRAAPPSVVEPQEEMLIDLIRRDPRPHCGLGVYIRNLMDVMCFDAGRRGRLISGEELGCYTRSLATAVTEALHYFIGRQPPARSPARYLAASGAHIAHMLRDTREDIAHGYFNIPREVLAAGGIAPDEVESEAYREWIRQRVVLARRCLRLGRAYLSQVDSLRCRIACLAYCLRFEHSLNSIEDAGFVLRPDSLADRPAAGAVTTFLAAAVAALNPPQRWGPSGRSRDLALPAGRSVRAGPP